MTGFMRWVLTDGQRFVPESGYVNLDAAQLAEQLAKLGPPAAGGPRP